MFGSPMFQKSMMVNNSLPAAIFFYCKCPNFLCVFFGILSQLSCKPPDYKVANISDRVPVSIYIDYENDSDIKQG